MIRDDILEGIREGHSVIISGLFNEDHRILMHQFVFPFNKSYKVHLHYAGALAQIIEGIFGGEWEGHEVKCEAKGDSYCEFVIKRKIGRSGGALIWRDS